MMKFTATGNSYTAEYWQYDSRLGRRWNVDPVVKEHESPYATFANNPIWFVDPLGADSALAGSDNTPKSEAKQTDLSKIALLKKGVDPLLPTRTINIMVMGTGEDYTKDTDPTSGWSDEDLNNPYTIGLYAKDLTDLKAQLKTLTEEYNIGIGNVFISSHGSPSRALVYVGATPMSPKQFAF
jgi:hypothetical protein